MLQARGLTSKIRGNRAGAGAQNNFLKNKSMKNSVKSRAIQ